MSSQACIQHQKAQEASSGPDIGVETAPTRFQMDHPENRMAEIGLVELRTRIWISPVAPDRSHCWPIRESSD